VYFIKIIFIIT